ncbi:sugar phosphate isomerase/epimerase [Bacillus sp. 03113]|uniref:sugar phosphate isomerase/epimerase family protein n=1 Tax=Bacillus sp. 03113 TaxID=2578211 RepID=UPI001143FB06|nr:sugar phosphate isomerase/epimerase [Bacillus sp. 03113]
MADTQVGLQMYTLRHESEKDFVGTLEMVAKMGFQGVEFAGYWGLTTKELKSTIDALGLQTASNHIKLTLLENELSNVIDDQHVLENKHIVCPFLPSERRSKQDYYELIKVLNDIGRKCAEEGITLSYHNHDFELIELDNGEKPLELLLKETNPEWVKAELDIYWLTKAGEDPVEWLKRYQNRTPLIHLKDMTVDGEKFFAELGTGGVNLEGVLNEGNHSNIEWLIVEQDQTKRSPIESIAMSMKYLKEKFILI